MCSKTQDKEGGGGEGGGERGWRTQQWSDGGSVGSADSKEGARLGGGAI